jgi:hypothetical protein
MMLGVVLGASLAWPTTPALAQPASAGLPLTLDWSAPASCPSRARVLDQVITVLGRSSASRATVSVAAVVESTPRGKWRVRLVLASAGESGRRQFEAESCEAAADATALIVALAIDPNAMATALPLESPEPAPDRARPPIVQPTPPVPIAPAAPATSAPSAVAAPGARVVATRLSFGGELGTLSRATGGGELAVGVVARRWQLEATASDWTAATSTPAGQTREGARLGVAALGLRGGYRIPLGEFALAPLLGTEVDWISAAGFGGTARTSKTAPLLAFDVGATAAWSVTRSFALACTLEAVVPTSRPLFVASEVQRTSLAGGRALLGLEWRPF